MFEIKNMPKEKGIEQGLDMLREGYLYISNRCQSFQSDVFETRLLGEKAICMKGKEAAKLFYDNNKFKRAGAAPKRAQKTLLGEGGVQGLDGKPHRHRKSMFMSMMNDESLEKMRQLIKYEWEFAARHFTDQKEIILYEESKKIIMRAICSWAGVPLKEDEVKKWCRLSSKTDPFSRFFTLNFDPFGAMNLTLLKDNFVPTLFEFLKAY